MYSDKLEIVVSAKKDSYFLGDLKLYCEHTETRIKKKHHHDDDIDAKANSNSRERSQTYHFHELISSLEPTFFLKIKWLLLSKKKYLSKLIVRFFSCKYCLTSKTSSFFFVVSLYFFTVPNLVHAATKENLFVNMHIVKNTRSTISGKNFLILFDTTQIPRETFFILSHLTIMLKKSHELILSIRARNIYGIQVQIILTCNNIFIVKVRGIVCEYFALDVVRVAESNIPLAVVRVVEVISSNSKFLCFVVLPN